MQTETLAVSDEFAAFGAALGGVIAGIKAKDPLMTDVTAFLTPLAAAIPAMGSVGADIKLPENQAFLIYSILKALGV